MYQPVHGVKVRSSPADVSNDAHHRACTCNASRNESSDPRTAGFRLGRSANESGEILGSQALPLRAVKCTPAGWSVGLLSAQRSQDLNRDKDTWRKEVGGAALAM